MTSETLTFHRWRFPTRRAVRQPFRLTVAEAAQRIGVAPAALAAWIFMLPGDDLAAPILAGRRIIDRRWLPWIADALARRGLRARLD